MLEKTLESPLDYKEIKPVNPKGNQPWILIGNSGAEVETPILWPPDAKSQLTGKDPDAWKDWGQEKGSTEDEMFGWLHQLNGHEFEQTLGDSKGQGDLVSWVHGGGRKELDMTERLNNNNNNNNDSQSFVVTLPSRHSLQMVPQGQLNSLVLGSNLLPYCKPIPLLSQGRTLLRSPRWAVCLFYPSDLNPCFR